MKVLIVSLNFSPEPTATGKYTGEMAEWLVSRGHDVTAISAPPHYPQWEVFENYRNKGFQSEFLNGIEVKRVPCYIPCSKKVRGFTRILMEVSFTLLSVFYWLPLFFSSRRFDAVIAICPPMQTAVFSLLYSKTRNVPFIFHVQDFQVDMAFRLGILKPNIFNRMLYKLEGFFIKRASYVSSITEAMLKRAEAKGVDPDRLIFLPNWADIQHVAPRDRNNALRKELGYTDSDFVVLYSGGMGVKQGLELLLEAAENTLGNPSIKYLIVGEGGAKDALVETAANKQLTNVQFLPLQPYEVLPDLLALSDVNVIIQRSEASDYVMPSKLTNILSAGRPVIATATEGSGLFEVIMKNQLGAVCEPGDVLDLVRAIEQLFHKRSELAVMGRAARQYAESYLDKEQILQRFEIQLKSISSGGQI